MAYITTDTDIATTLSINKTVQGQQVPGYPKSYSILAAFGGLPEITENDWRKMTSAPRLQRIEAFKAYINEVEQIDVDATQANDVFRASDETPGEVVEW